MMKKYLTSWRFWLEIVVVLAGWIFVVSPYNLIARGLDGLLVNFCSDGAKGFCWFGWHSFLVIVGYMVPLFVVLLGFGWLVKVRPSWAMTTRILLMFVVVFLIYMAMLVADWVFGIGAPTSPYHSHLVRDIFFSLLGAAILSGAILYGKMLVDCARKEV